MITGGVVQQFFQRDHEEIDVIYTSMRRNLQNAIDNQKPVTTQLVQEFEEFDRRLERHIGWEEDLLFPAVEKGQTGLREGPGMVMRMEHVEIRKYKKNAREELKRENAESKALAVAADSLDQMLGILEDHNRKEEQIYYPMADEILTTTQVSDLMRIVRQA